LIGGLCILRAGDAIAEVAARRGEFAKWIRDAVGDGWSGAWREHDLRSDALPPALGAVPECRGFIITGSSSSVIDRAPWMLRAQEYIRAIAASGTPLFGICFGHQLIGQALGGLVTRNPRGREIGTVQCRHVARGDRVFAGVPETFDVNATHVDTVARLPVGARILATTALEPHAAYAIGEKIRCMQFHPEVDGDAMRGYIAARAHFIRAEGGDADMILANATDAPYGAKLLRNFAESIDLGARPSIIAPAWSPSTSAQSTTS
jgi:GMP synthase (glutamine-hydrolysing)